MKHFFLTALLAAGLTLPASSAWAQHGGHGGGHSGGGGHAMSGGASRGFGGGAVRGGGRAMTGPNRGGPLMGHAVRRGSVGPGYRPYRGYGYGGYGLYGPAFGLGYYDPLWGDWEYGYPGYGYPGDGYGAPYMVPPDAVTGGLRIEVKPDTAEVFVDGHYAGIVDDFDGHFQHLNLTPGPHHIEMRAPGYGALAFDTMIQEDHTTHYKGSLGPTNGSVQ